MIESVGAYPLLTGLCGQPPADLGALSTALSRLSLFAAAIVAAQAHPHRPAFLTEFHGGDERRLARCR